MNIAAVVAPQYLDRVREIIKRKAGGEMATSYELEVIARSGERRTLEVSSRPILGEGRPVGVQGIARDVTERKRAEENLRKQDEFIRAVIDLDPNLIFVKDEKGRFTLVNRAVADLCGLSVDAMIGKRDADISPNRAAVEQIERDDQEVLVHRRERFVPEERITTRTGKTVWLQTVKRPLVSGGGRICHLLGVATDITARKLAEDALRDSQALYLSLVECLPIAVFRKDLEGKFTFGNSRFCQLLGRPIESILGRTDFDFSPAEFAQKYQMDDRRVLQTREVFETIEEHLTRKDGTRTFVQVIKAPVLNAKGEVIGVQGTIWDVTERRREEEELKRTRSFLNQVVENLPIAIFIKEAKELRFVHWNKAGEELIGISKQEMIGHNDYDFFPKPDADSFVATDRQVLTSGKLLDIAEEIIPTRHQGKRVIHTKKIPILDEQDRPLYLLGIAEDITERRLAEEELKRAMEAAEMAAQAKGEFLANMSHEIRTPMNAVIGMTNLLLDTELTDEQRDFANTVKCSADGLLTIINDILDFSKMEAGKLHFEILNFNLRDTVETTMELMSERAVQKKLEIVSFVPQEINSFLRGDPGRLRQILLNLVGNAVKFTEKGDVVLNVSQTQESQTDVTLLFEVTDTGIGIAPGMQARLFQPFTQADGSTTRKFGGTGLGLAICKQLVAMMHGEIGLRSEPGHGSTFWFTARFEKQPAGTVTRHCPQAGLEDVRLLVVDDNAVNRRILRHHVVSWRMQNGCAASAHEAMDILVSEAAAGRPYDIVILDMQMPEVDGMMLARRIRKRPEVGQTKMLLLTSLGHQFKKETLAEAGIAACLVKPVKQSDLYNRLIEVLAIDECVGKMKSPPHAAAPRLVPEGWSRSLRILLAEDNSVNQKVALRQLQKLGHQADAVSNGLEVLAALKSISYDVILMDCHMPEMDGYETTQQLRQDPRTRTIRIIAMTANAMQGDREKCLTAGMDDYISKPVTIDNLKAALERSCASEAPEPSQERHLPVVNLKSLEQLKDLAQPGEPNPLIEFIDLFLADVPDCLGQIRAALNEQKADDLRRLAHSLKGSAGNLGAEDLSFLCHELEMAAKHTDLATAPRLIQHIEAAFAQVQDALTQERARCEELV
ncbi:MAG: PAS domain S-box protein [Verrucomicrobiales bacterium]|nr:PAS domain S-box protein [Verrucomicrobiales bacterium]